MCKREREKEIEFSHFRFKTKKRSGQWVFLLPISPPLPWIQTARSEKLIHVYIWTRKLISWSYRKYSAKHLDSKRFLKPRPWKWIKRSSEILKKQWSRNPPSSSLDSYSSLRFQFIAFLFSYPSILFCLALPLFVLSPTFPISLFMLTFMLFCMFLLYTRIDCNSF